MTEYVTTNIRFPKQLYREIKRLAAEEDKSMAQVLREAAAEYIASTASTAPATEEVDDDDPLWLIGTDPVDLGVTDASVNFDEYLYGPLSEAAKAEIED
jgi:predicted DNA-binding protein